MLFDGGPGILCSVCRQAKPRHAYGFRERPGGLPPLHFEADCGQPVCDDCKETRPDP
jgi:hypothetical protein